MVLRVLCIGAVLSLCVSYKIGPGAPTPHKPGLWAWACARPSVYLLSLSAIGDVYFPMVLAIWSALAMTSLMSPTM